MKKLFFIFLFIPSLLFSQTDTSKGIHFVQGLSWEQVKQKAKDENKYIFVDCYATWCRPCKWMDNEVYTQPTVGDFINKDFVAVKIQTDTSLLDNEGVKKMYPDATIIKNKYNVDALPTYLFFSPKGTIVHKYIGALSDTDFIKIAKQALDSNKQFYTLLNKYNAGLKNYQDVRYLSGVARAIGDNKLADTLARDYISNYLNKLTEQEIYSQKHMEFIRNSFQVLKSSDKCFKYLYHHSDKVDQLMNQKGLSQSITDNVITREEIDARLWPSGKMVSREPDWISLTKSITKKYDVQAADRIVLNAQLRWYGKKKDWCQLIKYDIKRIELYGLDTAGIKMAFTNNMIYYIIFMHSENKEELTKASEWMKLILQSQPEDYSYMDTYANLLYKIGSVNDALEWEEKALKISKNDKEIRDTYEKMKKGVPTWPLSEQCGRQESFSKPSIDTSVFGKWPYVINPFISNDGNLVWYYIKNQPIGSNTLVMQSTQPTWELEIPGAKGAAVTENSKYAMLLTKTDSLCIVDIGMNTVKYITDVLSFELLNCRSGDWLAYLKKDKPEELILQNIVSGKSNYFVNVKEYYFSKDGKIVLLQTEKNRDSTIIGKLNLINLAEETTISMWSGSYDRETSRVSNLVFDKASQQIAFTIEQRANNTTETFIWYYKLGMNAATLLSNNKAIPSDLEIVGINDLGFTKDGDKIYINLKNKAKPKSNFNSVAVDVWSYTDSKLQSQQLKDIESSGRMYHAIINVKSHHIVRLDHDDENIIGLFDANNDYVLILKREGDVANEWHWNKKARTSIYLISTKDGSRKLIGENIPESNYYENVAYSYRLSPMEKYVTYYSPREKNYFGYEIATEKTRNITKGIPATWTTYAHRDIRMAPNMPIDFSGTVWEKDDASLLLYDQNDIYKVDPLGISRPVNVTNGYGRKHGIVFQISKDNFQKTILENKIIRLNAFNRNNKENGFYLKDIDKAGDPELLTMQPYVFEGTWESDGFYPAAPKKARDSDSYIVRRMSASESPNYFYTKDFKTFKSISNVYPEKMYNWLTTELITWKTLDGSLSQGILYKPENFDPKKKYPIIFYYYERLTEGLNGFRMPEETLGTLNIPYYVSRGYLVFTPDIHYKIGYQGRSALNTIVSAANYLSKYPWVDPGKMGIQGHSRGGYQTNYIVTHTNLFAAAMSASGMSDFVSLYGGIRESGVSRQGGMELYFQRIGASLWEKPDLYIENSPVFKADKVTTPLLMMSNKNDGDVPFSQGLEFFTALRRLGKKSWMLQYDGQGHVVFDKAADDLEIRMQQFFNHYLKSAPAPIWMTQGIPAKLKGIETGLAYDPSGNCGKDCKVCKYWNEKFKKDSVACWKEIEERRKSENWQ